MKNAGFGIALSSLALLIGCNENPSNPAVESGHRVKTEAAPYIVSPYKKEAPVTPPQDLDRSAKFSGLAKAAAGAWIGLVSKFSDPSCADGTNFYSLMRTDDEDDDNQNFLNLLGSNKTKVGGLYNSNGGVGASTVTFCQTFVSSLPRAKFDYAVLNPFSSCPTNSQRMHIHIDNEDDDNNNYENNSALITPMGTGGGNSEWFFCFVPKDAVNGQSFPQIGSLNMDNWMIWAKEKGSYFGYQRVDDEDNNNENSCSIAGTTTACPSAFLSIVGVTGGSGSHTWAWSALGPTHPSFENVAPPATCNKPTCIPGSTPLCIIQWNAYNQCSN
jgi:hypothetical protein